MDRNKTEEGQKDVIGEDCLFSVVLITLSCCPYILQMSTIRYSDELVK
jgi:hypothetical protein